MPVPVSTNWYFAAVQGDGVDGINIRIYWQIFMRGAGLDGDSVLCFWMQAGKYPNNGSRFLEHDGTPLRGPLNAAASTTAAAAASAFAVMAFQFLVVCCMMSLLYLCLLTLYVQT
jgi:hypothetical protein